jgi:magnesium transporter
MVHLLFGPEVREMLEQNDVAEMREFCESLHPATVAETLVGEFDVEQIWRFLESTNIRNQAAIFEYFPEEWQVKMAEGAGRERMAHLIEKMSHDDRVDLLHRLPPPVADGLLRLVDEADRRDIATLFKHAENTAGSIMTTDYAWLPPNLTTAEALERLRLQAPEKETIYYIFVLDENRKLLGVVTLRDLILASRQAMIRDIMEEHQVVRVKVSDDPEHVAQELARYDLLAIPVVDDQGRMVGIITHDDVIDVVVQEATEDVYRIGGVGPLTENYLEGNLVTVWRKRAVWLAVLFVAELFTFSALAWYEDAIAEVVVLSLFVPLCISTGGNSGSQAATLTTRAMALGQITTGNWFRVLRHEVAMGLMLGITLGTIGFVRAWVTPESVRSNSPPRPEPFQVKMPKDIALKQTMREGELIVEIPARTEQSMVEDHATQVTLPQGEMYRLKPDPDNPEYQIYEFPSKCKVRHPPVDGIKLSTVIALSVASICLWGTLVGSMLPLFLKRLGFDPGIASSPFVATFVDVTGIIIYFKIASFLLLHNY